MDVSHLPQSNAQEAVIHHAANAAAIAIPTGAVVFNLPEWVAVVTGCLGIIWYSILILEKVSGWYRKWKHKDDVPEDPRDLLPEGNHDQHPH